MGRRHIAALAWPLPIGLTPPPPTAPPASDRAGNRSLPFEPERPPPPVDENRSPRIGTADRTRCAELSRESEGRPWRLDIFEGARVPRRIDWPGQDGEAVRFGLLPYLFREAGGAALIDLRAGASPSSRPYGSRG